MLASCVHYTVVTVSRGGLSFPRMESGGEVGEGRCLVSLTGWQRGAQSGAPFFLRHPCLPVSRSAAFEIIAGLAWPLRSTCETRSAAAGCAAAVFALVAAAVGRHEHAALGAGGRAVEGGAGDGAGAAVCSRKASGVTGMGTRNRRSRWRRQGPLAARRSASGSRRR